MSSDKENIVQFAPFRSFVSPTFWHKLSETKLDLDCLSDKPKNIYGFYTNRNAKSCLLELDYTAYNIEFKPPKYSHIAIGTIYNKNTIEEFRDCSKHDLLWKEGKKLLNDFESGAILDKPNSLARFFVLSFADLKNHNYYYWFGFPCPLTPTLDLKANPRKLSDAHELLHFNEILQNLPDDEQNFFVLKRSDTLRYFDLKTALNEADFDKQDVSDVYFCFADASEYEYPSWMMRIYAAFLFHQCPSLIGKTVNFLGVRYDNQMKADNSLIWQVTQTLPNNFDASIKFVGWELNNKQKMGPRMASMGDSMLPEKLAENSVNLNLKLMKWRLVPDLNLETIANAKCLLFGAGTLGCAVSRNLLGWGFKNITFLDNGRIGYANPVRQCLYTHDDAAAGNKMKATTAALHLKEINPNVNSTGYVMQIPMPGHTIGEAQHAQTNQELLLIAKLVQAHDIIFLLTDSRESRWLPTLMGAAHNKIVINAALGFDSYLVMRHGCNRDLIAGGDTLAIDGDIDGLKCINGTNLGCYFCNDVTAPGNSLRERTLDQQCTVTRPGVSNIAASYAVELLVSLLQHPLREAAPAYYSITGKSDGKIPEGLLGIIPHSIRGMLFNFENILPATEKFQQCIACSEKVLAEYRKHGNEFLFKAFETAKYLEDLTGISEYEGLANEIIDFDDSDLEM